MTCPRKPSHDASIRSAKVGCQHNGLGTLLQDLNQKTTKQPRLEPWTKWCVRMCKNLNISEHSENQANFHHLAFLMVGRAPSIRWVLVILVGSALSFRANDKGAAWAFISIFQEMQTKGSTVVPCISAIVLLCPFSGCILSACSVK